MKADEEWGILESKISGREPGHQVWLASADVSFLDILNIYLLL